MAITRVSTSLLGPGSHVKMHLQRSTALRGLALPARSAGRHMSVLPYRIRAPLAKLQERKKLPQEVGAPGAHRGFERRAFRSGERF